VPLYDPANPANTWRLRDAVDFDFPTNVTMVPRSYILVVGFDPATNAAVRAAFETKYGKNALLFGPYTGKLDNRRDDLKLYSPDSPQTLPGPEFGMVPYILVDRVKYSDVAPWPAAADGTGPSLQRRQVSAYGNEPANWFASGFTPGTSPDPDSDRDNDGMPDAWETAHGLIVGVNDAALDPDQDGLNNLQEYLAGTDPRNGLSSLKLEALKRGTEVLLRFTAQPNKAYAVHVCTDLTSGAWQTLSTISAQPLIRTIELSDPAVADTHRYYRLLTPPAP
jgi:hypothetical protein